MDDEAKEHYEHLKYLTLLCIVKTRGPLHDKSIVHAFKGFGIMQLICILFQGI
jgi:hypothetical protein